MHIIVVLSDEPATVESTRLLLEKHGLVWGASSLPAAQEQIITHEPDLLIIDSALFKEHLDLTLRQLQRLCPGVPLLLLTLMDEQSVKTLVDGEGVHVIRKPFDRRLFVEKCEQLLELSRLREENRLLRGDLPGSEREKEHHPTITQLRQQRLPESGVVGSLFPQPLSPFSVTQGLYLILPRLNLFLQALANVFDVERLVRRVVEGFTELFGLSFCSLLVLDEKNMNYRIGAAHGLDETLRSELRLSMDSPLIRWLLGSNHCLSRPMCRGKEAGQLGFSLLREMKILRAEWCLPLRNKGRLLGLIGVSKKATGRALTEEEVDLLMVLASYVTIAMENALFYHRLSYQKSFNESILHYLGSGVLAIDAEGRVLSVNRNGERILNCSSRELLGRDIGVAGSVVADILLRTLEENRSFSRHEFVYPGNRKLIGASTTVMSDEEGRRLGAIMVFADLSDLKSAAADTQQDRIFEELINLTAWLAHEIKNPLVAIKTFTQLLPEKFDDPQFRGKFQSVVQSEVARLDSVVENVIEFGKREELKRQPMDIHTVLDRLLEEMEAELKTRKMTIRKEYEVTGEQVAIDETLMSIALKHLFLDAIGDAPAKELLLRTSLSSGDDNGDKRPEKHLKVFLGSSRQQRSLSEWGRVFPPYTGSGRNRSRLALGVAQKIIRQHQGWLEVANGGTPEIAFAVVLPTV